MTGNHHRPLLQPSTNFDWIIGSDEPGAAHRIAQETSWALLDRVRSVADPEVVERVVGLASRSQKSKIHPDVPHPDDPHPDDPHPDSPHPDHHPDEAAGIDDIAELWAGASPHSLAGQLWRIYLLRRIIASDPEGTTDLFRIGLATNQTIDPVVAGASEPVDPQSIAHLGDEILRGVFAGDLAVALERASSYCRIMARGSASLADDRDVIDDARAARLTTRALRYSEFAADLHAGARRWRDGTID